MMIEDGHANRCFHHPRDPAATSFLMSRVRAKDTRIEVALRSALHRAGYRFRKNPSDLVGKPDIVFRREKVAVFVDGDFWHARILVESGLIALKKSLKTSNRGFWIAKLRRNSERDVAVIEQLERLGWRVVRLWETDLKKNIAGGVCEVLAVVEKRRWGLHKPG